LRIYNIYIYPDNIQVAKRRLYILWLDCGSRPSSSIVSSNLLWSCENKMTILYSAPLDRYSNSDDVCCREREGIIITMMANYW